MTARGRPLRFVGVLGTLWISARVAILWQQTGSLPQAIERALPVPRVIAAAPALEPRIIDVAARRTPWQAPRPIVHHSQERPDPIRTQLALLAMVRFGQPIAIADASQISQAAQSPGVEAGVPPRLFDLARPSRWSASGWAIVRPGTGMGSTLGAPQLGGSQAGARIDYALGRSIALTGRVATPLQGPGREMALGVAFQPVGVPVRVIAEQRIAIDRGRGGPSLAVAGGVSDRPIAAGFRLEGYAQGGVIAWRGTDAYIDGLARIARPVAADGRVDLGLGLWGGAQRGAARLDVGPTAALRVPLADRAVRLTLDWRQRVVGNARPGSGPALSLGSDF